MKNIQMVCVILALCCMQACSPHKNTQGSHVANVEKNALSNTLYYSGTIAPLQSIVVPSPAEGVIIEMPFQYGDSVKAGQLLFLLSSSKFVSDYKTALMQYIKAKSDFNNSQTQLSESEFLHKNQLISDDDYKMKQSNFYSERLVLLQAKDVLQNLLQQLDVKDVNLYNLTIADIDKITQAMHLQMDNQNLKVIASADGVVLAPIKAEDDNKKLGKGDLVKQGDVLALLGDLNGLSVRIKVNELVVNQLKAGQKVKVTGIAFPDYTLQGEIKRIDRQGEGSNNGLPTFSADIVVPKLTELEQHEIHVGMSAKVEIQIEQEAQITVPITALQEKNGNSYVQIIHENLSKPELVQVITGKTTLDKVVILSGLKPGDKIVIPD